MGWNPCDSCQARRNETGVCDCLFEAAQDEISRLTSALAASDAALARMGGTISDAYDAAKLDSGDANFIGQLIDLRVSRDTAVARAERAEKSSQRSWCPGCRGFLLGGTHFEGRACGTCHTTTISAEQALDAALARVREVESERDRLREAGIATIRDARAGIVELGLAHESALAAARADAVREFAEWEVDNNGGHFTPSDLRDDAARYLAHLSGKEPRHD